MIGPEETRRHNKFEAKIVDPVSGEALPPGNKGELWLRSPTIMTGYVGNEKATAQTLDSEGRLKTGDLCYFDSEGFLYIVDRLKELIKYKAYQVAPAELELLLLSNPEIADAVVISYPDEDAGQTPMAFVVRKSGSNSPGFCGKPGGSLQENKAGIICEHYSKICIWQNIEKGTSYSCSLSCFLQIVVISECDLVYWFQGDSHLRLHLPSLDLLHRLLSLQLNHLALFCFYTFFAFARFFLLLIFSFSSGSCFITIVGLFSCAFVYAFS